MFCDPNLWVRMVNDSGTQGRVQSAARSTRRRFLRGTAATVPLALAGCFGGGDDGSAADDDGEPQHGGTLNWGGSVPVQSLDPHFESAAASARVIENITEGLVRLNWDYEVEPHLAESFDVSDDQTEMSFSIRQGVQFHDGTELTSEDVVATFDRIAEQGGLASDYFGYIDSYEAPDEYSFELYLNEPFAPMLSRLATKDMHILTAEQAAQEDIEELIGTGPFEFESRELEHEFVMVRNENYWREDYPYLDRVEKTEMPDAERRLDTFRAGEVDFVNDVPPRHADQLENDPEVDLIERFPKSLTYLGMNCEREPFDDKDARLALDYAIDKEKVIEAALYGKGQPAASPGVPNSPWEHPDLEVRPQDFDRAREHLERAGYPDGYEATFKIPEQYDDQVSAAQVIQSDASEVGIELDIELITWSNWLSDVYTDRNFQATTSSYLAIWEPDDAYHKFLHPEGAFFFTGWTNEEYNELVEQARTEFDTEARAELYHQAAEIQHEERSGHLLLYWMPNLHARSNDYSGEVMSPDGSTFRFEDTWLE